MNRNGYSDTIIELFLGINDFDNAFEYYENQSMQINKKIAGLQLEKKHLGNLIEKYKDLHHDKVK